MEEVEWKIFGYQNGYRASPCGRIQSRVRGRGHHCKDRFSDWADISPAFCRTDYTGAGYYQISYVHDDGKRRSRKVHRIIAMLFCPNPDGKAEVDHIDGNRANNCASNLRWVSRAENAKAAGERGVFKKNFGKGKKLTLENYRLVFQLVAEGKLNREIAQIIGFDVSNVSRIRNGKLMAWAKDLA